MVICWIICLGHVPRPRLHFFQFGVSYNFIEITIRNLYCLELESNFLELQLFGNRSDKLKPLLPPCIQKPNQALSTQLLAQCHPWSRLCICRLSIDQSQNSAIIECWHSWSPCCNFVNLLAYLKLQYFI